MEGGWGERRRLAEGEGQLRDVKVGKNSGETREHRRLDFRWMRKKIQQKSFINVK